MTFIEKISVIPDPRVERTRKHPLVSLLTIACLAVICGAEGWSDIAEYGRRKRSWLNEFLDLPHGIPSEDTFARVLSILQPGALQTLLSSLIRELAEQMNGQVIAIDGKTVRRSHNRSRNKKALHLVSAWASEYGVVLGQVATDEKSNEITAIPKLLELLELKGAIVTIDAMGTQTEIAADIVKGGADYVLQLKANQSTFHREVVQYFEGVISESFEPMNIQEYKTIDGEHGRIETRKTWATSDISWFEGRNDWKNLESLIRVERTREIRKVNEGNVEYTTEHEVSYYISSLPPSAALLSSVIRQHWGIENGLHWTLDMAFKEDLSRIRVGEGAENIATLRKIAINLLKQEKSLKRGVAAKRMAAGWDDDYLFKVLNAQLD